MSLNWPLSRLFFGSCSRPFPQAWPRVHPLCRCDLCGERHCLLLGHGAPTARVRCLSVLCTSSHQKPPLEPQDRMQTPAEPRWPKPAVGRRRGARPLPLGSPSSLPRLARSRTGPGCGPARGRAPGGKGGAGGRGGADEGGAGGRGGAEKGGAGGRSGAEEGGTGGKSRSRRARARGGRGGGARFLAHSRPARVTHSHRKVPGLPDPRGAAADPGKERHRAHPPATRRLRATIGTGPAPDPPAARSRSCAERPPGGTASGVRLPPGSLARGPAPSVSELRCEGDAAGSPLALGSWSRRIALRPCDQARAANGHRPGKPFAGPWTAGSGLRRRGTVCRRVWEKVGEPRGDAASGVVRS